MSKIPKLRFKEFSGEWEEKRYGEIYSFYSTNSFSRDKLNYDNGLVKNIHYGDIHTQFNTQFNIKKENVPFINNNIDLSKIKEDSYCLNGDLVIADASEDYNDIGKTMEIVDLNNEKVIAGLHTFLARPNKYEMALGYISYLLQSWKVRKQVMTIAQGTKVLSLSTGRLSNIKLNLPQKQEQEKIASFLTQIDTKIEQLTKKDKLLHSYKKGVMQKIFSQEIRFKDDDGNEFEDWEVTKLGKICTLQGGFAFKSNEFKKSGIPIIRISNISNNHNYIEKNNLTYYNEIKSDDNFTIKYGDLLIAMSGATTGKSSIYNLNNKAYLNQRVGLFKVKSNLINGYLIQFVFSSIFLKQLDVVLVAGAQPNISSKDIENFKINLPPLKEQIKIANFLSSIDKKIESVSNQLAQTKEFKKGLLQKMFV